MTASQIRNEPQCQSRSPFWPDYRAVWRWHFYAGLLCLPFFCWLAITGSIYLFRPDIEAWLDRPYENLTLDGPRALPSQEAVAAVAALPGSVFSHYEPSATPTGAAQIVVARDDHLYRVVIHPTHLTPMHIGRDDHRPMDLIAHLHGQLLLGQRGSLLVETAGSWGIVMILTGLYLWLPRGRFRLAGVVYPRLSQRGRIFWRDLHSVSGLWISVVTLLLLLSGMPWSSFWGNYLTWVRNHWTETTGVPDWPVGGVEPSPNHAPTQALLTTGSAMPGMNAAEMAAMSAPVAARAAPDLHALDAVVPAALALHAPRPVWVLPPAPGQRDWVLSSRIQDRPLRVTYQIDPAGRVTGRSGFAQENVIDRVVNVAVAAHEGHLFGRLNQAILLANALCILLVTVSAAVMWWRRRPAHGLGAPPVGTRPAFSMALAVSVVALALLFPLFGLSLVAVLLLDRIVLRQLPSTRRWLGLTSTAG